MVATKESRRLSVQYHCMMYLSLFSMKRQSLYYYASHFKANMNEVECRISVDNYTVVSLLSIMADYSSERTIS